jgi:hypothetical protein
MNYSPKQKQQIFKERIVKKYGANILIDLSLAQQSAMRLSDIGRKYGLTREYARQIFEKYFGYKFTVIKIIKHTKRLETLSMMKEKRAKNKKIKTFIDLLKKINKHQNPRHYLSGHKLYRVWNGMLSRCENSENIGYKNYGFRGICVCEEWHNFLLFYDWAINNGYNEHLTIDRSNNNGNYEPINCRFVNKYIQNRNTRLSKRWVIFDKVYESKREAAKKLNVAQATIVNWCNGKNHNKNLDNCYSYQVYE